jgi:hypothetical protein
MQGRPLGTHMLRSANDPEVVARKLLREKHGRSSFYAAISYPHWGRYRIVFSRSAYWRGAG